MATMRNPPPANINTWMGHKEQGKIHFQNEEYEQALASYRAALNPEYACPSVERQILLSNVVACRLKIGGPAMARAAVEDAKQCVAINESWAKGHIRLASAYIALGDHSNDACNSLQRAISLDPGNPTARQMLMRELRRDRVAPSPSAPPEEEVVLDDPVMIDEDLSWSDRLKGYYVQAVVWYHSQSDDVKNLLKLALILLGLYVAFGGRFGLDQLFGNSHNNRGNYGTGNAYDRYYGRAKYASSRQQRNPYEPDNSHAHQRQTSLDEPEYQPRQEGGRSFHFPNLFDGSPLSMICLVAIGYFCHRNGINPFHVIMMLNMMNGHRGGRRGMGGMYGMGGMGMGGMGYGMMHNRGFGGHGGFQRNRWR